MDEKKIDKSEYDPIFYIPCQFNNGVVCEKKERFCEACGWNPEVEAERKKEIRGEE